MRDIDMKKFNGKKIEGDKKKNQQVVSTITYSESPFFKKKDQEAKKFLEKHPIPNTFWK